MDVFISNDYSVNDILNLFVIEDMYNYNLDFEYNSNNIESLALNYATLMHKNQTRKDGTPYINHPIRVKKKIEKFYHESDLSMLKICAYLHDTLEDTNATYYDICNLFGYKVANIVLELTNDNNLKNTLGKTNYLQLKMINMSDKALIIKLCDRLDNCNDLINADDSFITKYQNETIDILNYLFENRELSSIHLDIINEIFNSLYFVDNKNIEKNIKVDDLINKINYYYNLRNMCKIKNCFV